jgi:hypothetical protein
MDFSQIKNAKQLVQKILEKKPGTRASDRKLIIEVWEAQGLVLSNEQKHKIRYIVMAPETIRRARQLIQERGLFRPVKSVANQRSILGKGFREQARNEKVGF